METLGFLDADGDIFGLNKVHGEIYITSHSRYIALNVNTAAQLWPILRHFAETGELSETPPTDAHEAGDGITLEVTTVLAETMIHVTQLDERLAALEAQHAPGSAHRVGDAAPVADSQQVGDCRCNGHRHTDSRKCSWSDGSLICVCGWTAEEILQYEREHYKYGEAT